MFHSDVRNGFDLDTWKEELKILHSVSMILMHYHWQLGKSTAQFYTALSDNLMKVLNKCYRFIFAFQNHVFSFSFHGSESSFLFIFLNKYIFKLLWRI